MSGFLLCGIQGKKPHENKKGTIGDVALEKEEGIRMRNDIGGSEYH
jgi:hypothetical protein